MRTPIPLDASALPGFIANGPGIPTARSAPARPLRDLSPASPQTPFRIPHPIRLLTAGH
ncbi:hypothetical protein Ari01nite_34380 [Paractinoplanes rishiriensis]|uniref:Uncharacterized protein n=1 Tax=Paractinoplanes rishiriensis TaxID=1050105 RepID=A0A919JZK0_9ACTN|nr:hypothetical protein Ari01nite_34380 [Actinoplanes rishiriensis]